VRFERSSGVLLHPTSLPSRYGIGELGPEAVEFAEFLAAAGQKLWQMLPLSPTGSGNSPYQSDSAFAGNPLLVSTERMVRDGLLDEPTAPEFPRDEVDYDAVAEFKHGNLRRAYRRFRPDRDYERFLAANGWWLEDYALFAALKSAHEGRPWNEWDPELKARKPEALAAAREELAEAVSFHRFVQYLFFRDCWEVKRAAGDRGVRLVGDIPIFVAHDSADVWANQRLFYLDDAGEPEVVAGVPPDYFSETGQLWGNPLYRWEAMAGDEYAWWQSRLRMALSLCDIVRVDHFRGFAAYWEIPAGEPTAVGGRWVEGPGEALFEVLRRELGEIPIIAEDLGTITREVEELRDRYGLPGMKVLQFAFSGPENQYLPHNYRSANCVVYTGTHDNDTTCGWWKSASGAEQALARRYLDRKAPETRDFIRLAMSSVADLAVFPMQDLLDLGSESRMNRPGEPEGNWRWRMRREALTPELSSYLRNLAELYNR
jgi:4-alpha-glucanotransferase